MAGSPLAQDDYWGRIGSEYSITELDVATVIAHRQQAGHKPREVCDGCPQPITNKIVKYWEDQGVKPRRKRGSFYN